MAKQLIDIGVEGNDGTGDSIRESFRKVNENFNELYAVFGIGGQVGFVDLVDTPNNYVGNENKVPVVKSDGSGIEFRELASDNALNGSTDTIDFDYSVGGKLVIKQGASRLSSDVSPSLGAPLNAASQAMGNISISQEAVDLLNSVHGTNLTIDDLVIDKGYADQNYLPKTIPGSGVRISSEPTTVSQYTITADSLTQGKFRSTSHGLTQVDTGASYIFNSTGTDPFGVTSGDTVYVRPVDPDNINLYATQSDAINNTSPILLSGGSGTFTITESAYDSELAGNWLSNVALPRNSVVRRQGDTMTGALILHDHPGDLAGSGTPVGEDDLQAATKLYVDNSSTTSLVNLYVTTGGNDRQDTTPIGKAGRSKSYAYRSIGAAARKAEELIVSSPVEIGPYVQTITHTDGLTNSIIVAGAFDNPIVDGSGSRINAKRLIDKNKNFIVAETVAYLANKYENISYNADLYEEDLKYILDSVSLDVQFGNNANGLSISAAKRLYHNIESQKNIFNNLVETVDGINYAKNIIVNNILLNTDVPTTYQERYSQFKDVSFAIDASADDAVASRFENVISVINNGVLNSPTENDGTVVYKINISNGGNGFVDQGNPSNTDIISGKVLRGKTSGATGIITEYNYEAGEVPVDIADTDRIEIRLLTPIEFISGEELEYGNLIKEHQVSIHVESGIYYEDFPIRISANTSIIGDDFRRTIIRPRDRISQSRYANLFFYRDAEFDGLVIGRSGISQISNITGADNNTLRAHHADSTAEVYTITDSQYTTTGRGKNAVFTVSVLGDGSVDIAITTAGTGFLVGDIVTIPDSVIGGDGGPSVTFTISETTNAKPYINPLTGNTDGYFGYHYLKDPNMPASTGPGYTNIGGWISSSDALLDNIEFIKEQGKEYLEDTYPLLIANPQYNSNVLMRDIGTIIRAYASDLRIGGIENTLQAQGDVYLYAVQNGLETETLAAYNYISSIAEKIILGEEPTTIFGTNLAYPAVDLFNGNTLPPEWTVNTSYTKGVRVKQTTGLVVKYYRAISSHTSGSDFATDASSRWVEITGPIETIQNFDSTISFAFDANYNPPLRNTELDVFMLNDACILQNITVQGQGGFMSVLDPEGQIITKSPFIHNGSSVSRSENRHVFRGGLFIDAFCGNSAIQVTGKVDSDPFRLNVVSLGDQNDPQGLFVRKPQVPAVFYIDGNRFQVNQIIEYDQDNGTAKLILDRSSNGGSGFTGITSEGDTGVDLDSATVVSPVDVVLQTAGNRSILGHAFTQINDLGYGLVAVNGALSEMVSMFTYYCWASYYSKNGSQIRSLSGSSCYGEYGLVAEGADPNEIPDSITLGQDMTQPAKTADAEVVLKLDNPFVFAENDVITQKVSGAEGTVTVGTSTDGNTIIYLSGVTGTFDTTNELLKNTTTDLGATSVPREISVLNAGNAQDAITLHVYDFKDIPISSSEFDIYHPNNDNFARYEISSIGVVNHTVGRYDSVNNDVPATENTVSGSGAVFAIDKTIANGYSVTITSPGQNYAVNDTFVVAGNLLGGATPANDATITVNEVGTNGIITSASISGTIKVDPTTPYYDGKIYRLNFSTGDGNFVQTGLIERVTWGEDINYRQKTHHLLAGVDGPRSLVTRPSNAVIFNENPTEVYRSIAFESTNVLGQALAIDEAISVFDSDYDYITLGVSSNNAVRNASEVWEEDSTPVGISGTLGATVGDTTIAVVADADNNEIFRLNNNARTPVANRPQGWSVETLKEAPIISWGGKKHYVFNYRTVGPDDVVGDFGASNAYALVDIVDTGDEINQTPSTGLAKSLIQGTSVITLRAGLAADADGSITVNISTCRSTGHDFLNVGTGGYNTTNYPNVIFGEPRTPDQSKEVTEKTKGRVFYVSTDQDGIFRVGRFFNVDQGTGNITFSGSLSLANVNGFGFRRGVVVNEFSTDSSMADNATDTVPTESATRGYVSRRLGFDDSGNSVPDPIGPGVLTSNGSVSLTGNLNASNNTITNLKSPASGGDAATKSYVDTTIGNNDTLESSRDVEQNNVLKDQLLVTTGYKKVILGTPTEGVFDNFTIGSSITGSVSGATGVVRDRYTENGINGFVLHLIYSTTTGTFQSNDSFVISGTAAAPVIDGPMDEWANGVWSTNSDIEISSTRQITQTGGIPSARYTELNIQYKPNTIINSDVNANAAIAQSKLNMNSATTRANATGITQAERGLASFDSANFTATDGWISLKTNGVSISDIEQINANTALANSTGSTANVTQVPFSTIVNQGGGLEDGDFTTIISSSADPGEALVKTGSGTYGITNVTTSGEINSIVKTRTNGDIQAAGLILGGNSTYRVLSLNGLELQMKTPAQGTILTAVGSSGNITVKLPENVDIGNTAVTKSVLQTNSNLNTKSYLGVNWIYSSFIEATGERGAASTGLAIGANTGKTSTGEVAIVTSDTGTNSSRVPFKFSKDGALPDTNNVYDIGSSANRYKTIYTNNITVTNSVTAASINATTVTATSFVGTMTGNADTADKWKTARTLTLNGDVSGSVSIDGSSNVTLTATVADDSHNHVISNVDGLQTALDGKANLSGSASQNFSADDMTATTVSLGSFEVKETSGSLTFYHNGTPIMRLTSTGNLSVAGDITGFDTL